MWRCRAPPALAASRRSRGARAAGWEPAAGEQRPARMRGGWWTGSEEGSGCWSDMNRRVDRRQSESVVVPRARCASRGNGRSRRSGRKNVKLTTGEGRGNLGRPLRRHRLTGRGGWREQGDKARGACWAVGCQVDGSEKTGGRSDALWKYRVIVAFACPRLRIQWLGKKDDMDIFRTCVSNQLSYNRNILSHVYA
jgi:hypothetical protein